MQTKEIYYTIEELHRVHTRAREALRKYASTSSGVGKHNARQYLRRLAKEARKLAESLDAMLDSDNPEDEL